MLGSTERSNDEEQSAGTSACSAVLAFNEYDNNATGLQDSTTVEQSSSASSKQRADHVDCRLDYLLSHPNDYQGVHWLPTRAHTAMPTMHMQGSGQVSGQLLWSNEMYCMVEVPLSMQVLSVESARLDYGQMAEEDAVDTGYPVPGKDTDPLTGQLTAYTPAGRPIEQHALDFEFLASLNTPGLFPFHSVLISANGGQLPENDIGSYAESGVSPGSVDLSLGICPRELMLDTSSIAPTTGSPFEASLRVDEDDEGPYFHEAYEDDAGSMWDRAQETMPKFEDFPMRLAASAIQHSGDVLFATDFQDDFLFLEPDPSLIDRSHDHPDFLSEVVNEQQNAPSQQDWPPGDDRMTRFALSNGYTGNAIAVDGSTDSRSQIEPTNSGLNESVSSPGASLVEPSEDTFGTTTQEAEDATQRQWECDYEAVIGSGNNCGMLFATESKLK